MSDIVDSHHPLDLPLDGWSDLGHADRADRGALVAIGGVAVLTDLAFRSGLAGLAGALLFVVLALSPVITRHVPNRPAVPLFAAAAVFALGLVGRTNPSLLALDVLASVSLVALGATYAKGGDPWDLTVPRLVARAVYTVAHGVLAPAYVLSARGRRRDTRWSAVVRGAVLAAPVVLLVGALLGSADAVFASFFRIPTDGADLALHAFLLVLGGWVAATVFRSAAAVEFAMPTTRRHLVGRTEVAVVLSGIVAVLALFAVAQLVAAVAGRAYVERTAGLSYADYARSGFFQLLAVAAVVLAVLLAARASTADDGLVTVLSEALVVLTLVVVAVAVRRLFLYEAAYGLTLLRVAAVLFAVWIGIVFVLAGASIAGTARERNWFLPAALTVGIVMIAAANVVNLDALVVHRNVDRFAGTDKLDVVHLSLLSDDAVPAIVDELPRLGEADASFIRETMCGGRGDRGVWEVNLSRLRADDALAGICDR